MAEQKRGIDSEIVNLDGGIFMGLPEQTIPLDAFGLNAKVIEPDVSDFATTQVMRRVKLDSLAPTALTAPVIERGEPAAKRSPSRAFAMAVAFGVGCLATAGVLQHAKPSAPAAPAAQAAMMVPVPQLVPVPVPVETPAQAKAEAAPVKAAPVAAKAAPVAAKAEAAPVKAAPVAAKAAPVKAEPVAAPVSTADLPMEMPEIPPPPKAPEVPFKASAAAVAIADAGLRAQACKEGDGPVSVLVSVTFVNSGRATTARVNGGPLLGTPAGSCVAQALRSATVPPFDGEAVTVNTTLHLH
jgi:hypothetical protein